MEKRYPAKTEEMPQGESGPNYSMPEDEKQVAPSAYTEPEMFVKQHKILPHLKGHRVYQTGETTEVPVPAVDEPQQQMPQTSEKAEEMGTAEPLRNLRILLNKVTKANFARISDTILNSFVYNREILEELSVLTWRQKV